MAVSIGFQQWQSVYHQTRVMADRIRQMRIDRAYALAATVGLPPILNCIHNAAIDDDLKGWCAGDPYRLRIAKQVNHMLNDWREHNAADRIQKRAWNRFMR